MTDNFVEQLMRHGEFMQDTATVTIVQGNYKYRQRILTTELVAAVIFSCGGTGKHILQCQ